MIWYVICFCGISYFLISRRKQLKKAILIAHYEAVYWLIGGAATIDDIVYASRNKIIGKVCYLFTYFQVGFKPVLSYGKFNYQLCRFTEKE